MHKVSAAIGKAKPPYDVAEVARHRQGCGGEHPRSAARFEYATQCGTNIEGQPPGRRILLQRVPAAARHRRARHPGWHPAHPPAWSRAAPAGPSRRQRPIARIASARSHNAPNQRTHGRVDTAEIITPGDARAASARARPQRTPLSARPAGAPGPPQPDGVPQSHPPPAQQEDPAATVPPCGC